MSLHLSSSVCLTQALTTLSRRMEWVLSLCHPSTTHIMNKILLAGILLLLLASCSSKSGQMVSSPDPSNHTRRAHLVGMHEIILLHDVDTAYRAGDTVSVLTDADQDWVISHYTAELKAVIQ